VEHTLTLSRELHLSCFDMGEEASPLVFYHFCVSTYKCLLKVGNLSAAKLKASSPEEFSFGRKPRLSLTTVGCGQQVKNLLRLESQRYARTELRFTIFGNNRPFIS